jgi:hypothetical protein
MEPLRGRVAMLRVEDSAPVLGNVLRTSLSVAEFAHPTWFENESPTTGSISPEDGMAR